MATPAKRKAVEMQDGSPPFPAPCVVHNETLVNLRRENEQLRRENEQLKCFVKNFLTTEGKIDSEVLPEYFQKEIEQVERKYMIDHIVRDKNSEWLDLPRKWKDDVEVACAMYSTERQFFIPEWKELPYHLLTNEQVLICALKHPSGPEWNEIPWWMKDNPNVMCAAYKSGKLFHLPKQHKLRDLRIALNCIHQGEITVEECECFTDPILRDFVEFGGLHWSMLPRRLQVDLGFAMSLSRQIWFNHRQKEILENIPDARGDRSFWQHFVAMSKVGIDVWVKEFIAPDLLSDRDFMLEMCCENKYALRLVPSSRLADRSFLEPLLARNMEALSLVPHETQMLFSDLIRDAISRITPHWLEKEGCAQGLQQGVNVELFEDRAFALTWYSVGLHHASSADDRSQSSFSRYKGDQEVALTYLKHTRYDFASRDLSPALLEDRGFVLEAVRIHPWLFHKLSPHLQSDHFVFTKFLAYSYEIPKRFLLDLHLQGNDAAVQGYLNSIRLELKKYNAFFMFICGATITRNDSACLLTLDQGPSTFLDFKQLLAEFLQVPTGEWLQDLRKAEHHVCKAIEAWTPDA